MRKKIKKSRKSGRKLSVKESSCFSLNQIKKIKNLAKVLCEGEGFELILLEWLNKPKRILRIYINKPRGEVSIDDCAEVSKQLSNVLDVEFDGLDSYFLEVSSPGFSRDLVSSEDFVLFKERKIRIRIKLIRSMGSRKNFSGEIIDISDNILHLLVEGKIIAIRHNEIESARLIVDDGDN